jgi:hypothetical protein
VVPDVLDDVDETTAEVIRLPGWAKSWRLLALLVTAGLFLAGTTVGQDDWWPFGPWRMYSTSTSPSGSVYYLAIQIREGDDPTWRPAPLTSTMTGLTRAEIEGRVPQMVAAPRMLGELAHSHSRLKPNEPAWNGVRVVRTDVLLTDGAPNGQVKQSTVVSWPN